MYTLFNNPSDIEKGVRQPASYNYLHDRLNDNLNKVIDHLRTSNYATKSNHLLVKLLLGLNVDPTLSIFDYYSKVQSRVSDVIKANGISSAIRKNDVFEHGIFYGDNTIEAIVAIEEDFDILTIDDIWRDLIPVKVLRHSSTALDLNPIDGKTKGHVGDFSIIQIDIVKLAIQYRQWYQWQINSETESIMTPMQFIYQYPIANAMRSHLDIALMNRLIALYTGKKTTEFNSKWPFYLTNIDDDVDKYLFNRILYLQRRPLEFEDILKQIELSSSNLLDLVKLPKTVITRQIEWIMVLSRTPIISFLVQVDFDIGSSRNRHSLSIIRKSLKILENDKSLKDIFPNDIGNELISKSINEIKLYL